MHFSAGIDRGCVVDASLSGWLRMCSAAAKIRRRTAAHESTFVSNTNAFM
jgi:hypothetical protein